MLYGLPKINGVSSSDAVDFDWDRYRKNKRMAFMTTRFFTVPAMLMLLIVVTACAPSSAALNTTTAIPSNVTIANTASPLATNQPTTVSKVLTIGEIASSPSAVIPKFQPMADYLAAHLSSFGYTSGNVKVAPDFATMINWLKNGDIDIVVDSVYPTMVMVDQAGVKPILRRWKSGTEQYYTVLFARNDANIQSVQDLRGKMVALEEPTSTSGYMLPKAYLISAGLNLTEKPSAEAPVASNEVGYVFTRPDNDVDIIQWVLSGKTPAGAVNSATFDSFSAESKKSLVVLGKTEIVARHVVSVRADLDVKAVDALKQILLQMDSSADGKAVLKSFENTTKFDAFPAGIETTLSRMRELFALTSAKPAEVF